MTPTEASYGPDQGIPRFVEWEADTALITVPADLLRGAGWKRVRRPVLRPTAAAYLDLDTGEIIKKRDMYRRRFPVPGNPGLRLMEQMKVINSLRKPTRDLCRFLLSMRNERGSFVRPLEVLIDGYIHRNGEVKRLARARQRHYELVGEIAAAGILADVQALGGLFQKHSEQTAQKVLEEPALWYGWQGIFRSVSGYGLGASTDEEYITTSKRAESLAI